jgi:acyl dehydratase
VRFDDVAVGDELPASHRVVTREDVAAYAEVSGDRNPLHLDDAAARRSGFPGIIAHGMFTMGHLASCLVAWTGDAAAVIRLRAAFRSPVAMGESIVAGGRVRALDPEARTATVELWVTVDRDGTVEVPIKRGEAQIRLE